MSLTTIRAGSCVENTGFQTRILLLKNHISTWHSSRVLHIKHTPRVHFSVSLKHPIHHPTTRKATYVRTHSDSTRRRHVTNTSLPFCCQPNDTLFFWVQKERSFSSCLLQLLPTILHLQSYLFCPIKQNILLLYPFPSLCIFFSFSWKKIFKERLLISQVCLNCRALFSILI